MSTNSTISNATHLLIREDKVLAEVGPSTSLLNEGRGEAVGVSDVVHQLGVDIIPELLKSQLL